MESKFESICNELVTLQKAKNADYGDSFSNSVKEFGLTAALIPITNKVNRLKQLLQSDSAQVKDESIDDTLKDLACYAIMTLAEREGDDIKTTTISLDELYCNLRLNVIMMQLNSELKDLLEKYKSKF